MNTTTQNKKQPKTNNQHFTEIVDSLPEFTHEFFFYGISENAILTKLSYARDIKYFLEFVILFLPYFPDKTLKEIDINDMKMLTPMDINKFLSWMDGQGLSEKTRARRKTSISVLYNYFINAERRLDFNPTTGAQKIEIEQNDYVIYLKLSEQKQLLNCIEYGTGLTKHQLAYHDKYKKRDLAIVFLFLDTGLRVSELNALNINDVIMFEDVINPENSECYIITLRKGHKKAMASSKVYFSDESKEYIKDYLLSREIRGEKFTSDTPLFTTAEGNRLSIREIQQMLKKYVKAALGRSDISVHKLRSSFAMEFYKSEHNILVLQQRMGHKSIAATNIYAKASDKEEAVKQSRNWRKFV